MPDGKIGNIVSDDIEEMDDDLSNDVVDDADAAAAAEKSVDAKSSDATDANEAPGGETSIVRDVVDDSQTQPDAASSAKEEDGSQAEDAAAQDQQQKEPDDENFTDVPFNKHPRFQTLLGRLKNAEVDAERYRNVDNFITSQNLVPEEARDLLEIGGLIKTNPAAAWERMKPTVQAVLLAAGEILPDDIRARVQAGELDQSAALELSRARAAKTSAETRLQFESAQDANRVTAENASTLRKTADDWAADRQRRDPNFSAKQPALLREVAWLQSREGKPNTPEGVRDQLQRAYEGLGKIEQIKPAPTTDKPAIKPVTGGQANATAQLTPKNTMDIIDNVISQRAAG